MIAFIMASADYDKRKSEFKKYFEKAREKDMWLRVAEITGYVLIGKVKEIGENLIYLEPSMVYEDATKKTEPKFRLEERLSTPICLNFILHSQAMTQEYVDAILSERGEDKAAGFK